MTDILIHALVAALFSFGWCTAFDTGMIFGRAGDWMEDHWPEWITKPLFGCPKCNAFWWATGMYWVYWGQRWDAWIMTGVCAIGINAIVLKWHSGMRDITKAIEECKPLTDE